ncbi:transposase domain-containing protein [Acidisoma sp. 7E03]
MKRDLEWATIPEFAAANLPGVLSERALYEVIKHNGYDGVAYRNKKHRNRQKAGGGKEYHFSILPPEAQVCVMTKWESRIEGSAHQDGELYQAAWRRWNQATESKRKRALFILKCLDAYDALVRGGQKREDAKLEVRKQFDIRKGTLNNWIALVRGIPRSEWAPFLLPAQRGREVKAEFTPEAWDAFCADYLRLEQPQLSDCYRRLFKIAKTKGWVVPSQATLQRRVDALPRPLVVLSREGDKALSRMYPAQERDRGVFHALEAVCADGHEWDNFVRWPDGYVGRPMMVAFQDLYSGKILSWRLDRSENKNAVRLAFGDVVEHYGIPSHCYLDNGRAFASKWLTGGIPNRYRFKVRDEEPDGLLKILGVTVHWARPFHGQAKPIERAFGEFARNLARHPAFAGSYTGNNPTNKPENYNSANAVDLQAFVDVLTAGIIEHNARQLRNTKVCAGRFSFDEVFERSYAVSPIRKATAEQRQLWLMTAEAVTCNRRDGSITFMGNRYWGEFLHRHMGDKLVVRFDPQVLNADLHVYDATGVYLGAAPVIDATGFNDVDAARSHARALRDWKNGIKQAKAAALKLTPQGYAAMLPKPEEPAPIETKVVRLVSGNTAFALPLPVQQAAPELLDDDEEDSNLSVMRAWRKRNVGSDAIVGGES